MKETIRFIGLDVHKEFISVAIADDGRGEVVSYGEIANTAAAISKLSKHLSRDGCDLCFVYEAGCFGFVICISHKTTLKYVTSLVFQRFIEQIQLVSPWLCL